jgi:hypothetical protein
MKGEVYGKRELSPLVGLLKNKERAVMIEEETQKDHTIVEENKFLKFRR